MSTLRPDTVRLDTVRLDRWVARAACRGSATGLFFPERYSRESTGAARLSVPAARFCARVVRGRLPILASGVSGVV
jgi:hypothetical protein